MEYLLYKLASDAGYSETKAKPEIPGECATFSPFNFRWLLRMLRPGGAEFIKVVILAAWTVVTGAAARADIRVWAYVGQGGRILHYSVVTPTEMHLPWLRLDETGNEIGGCFTVPSARGKKIYPYVLRQVALWAGVERPLYMIVEKGNAASRAGMERAGFKPAYNVSRRRRPVRPPVFVCINDN